MQISRFKEQKVSRKVLRSRLDYNPETGIFIWKDSINIKFLGLIAGYKAKGGYIQIKFHGTNFLAHRLAWFYMTGKWPEKEIDHINGLKDDNRWCNLRKANSQQNKMNVGLNIKNKSGYKGVFFVRNCTNRKWLASIKIKGKTTRLGYFTTPEEAALAYNKKAKELYGEFAFINKIGDKI